MDSDTSLLSPKTPFKQGLFRMGSPRFIELHRTPRSEGFRRRKLYIDCSSSVNDKLLSTPLAWTEETPPLSCSPTEVATPFKEILRNQSTTVKDSLSHAIPERKFYNSTIRRKSLLPLFGKNKEEYNADAVIQQPKKEASKRKRSKSADYRSRSKSAKLGNNLKHGIKRPKLKKAQKILNSSANKTDEFESKIVGHSTSSTPPCDNGKATERVVKHSVADIKPKIPVKKFSVKVNRMVRMNLQCGVIKFTKHAISPKKPPKIIKEDDGDALDVPETDNWIKSEVDNILSTLDKENFEDEEIGVVGQSCESETSLLSLNDTATHLSDVFCELGVKEMQEGTQPTVPARENESHSEMPSEMDVTSDSAFSSLYDISAEQIEDSNAENSKPMPSSTENSGEKLYPVFCKTAHGRPKQNTPSSTKSTKDRRRFPFTQDFFQSDDGMEQMVIDAGQKALGPSTCSECGFFFQKGDHSEEKMHKMYHGSAKPAVKHMGWKWERVTVKLPDGRVIRVCPGDPKAWWTKVEAVLEKANDDLGISFISKLPKDAHAYMFVGDGHILGCVIAEPIRVAYRMLENDRKEVEKVEIPEDDKVLELPKTPSFCSNTPIRGSRCGINRIWTCASERRKGIATKMLDAIRATFVYGHILRLDEIAFSDPTPLGMAFAQNYTKVSNFLVYKPNKN